jgi:hypothetical protein
MLLYGLRSSISHSVAKSSTLQSRWMLLANLCWAGQQALPRGIISFSA